MPSRSAWCGSSAWKPAIRSLGFAVPWLGWLEQVLPGPSAGSLAVALGTQPADGPFGVGVGAGGPVAVSVAVLVAYVAVFVLGAAAILRRRDI